MSLEKKINKINDLFKAPETPHEKAWGLIYDFYHIVLSVMEEKKISRSELARRLEVSRAAITKLLNESPNLTIKRMVEIADAVEVDITISTTDRDWFTDYATKTISTQDTEMTAAKMIKYMNWGSFEENFTIYKSGDEILSDQVLNTLGETGGKNLVLPAIPGNQLVRAKWL